MSSKPTILIFDEDAEELMQLITFLESTYVLTEVPEGVGCIEQALLQCPDLILLDDMVTEPNCYDICKRLKSDTNAQRIPIILMSDLSADELEGEIYIIGSDDYICKPIQKPELLEKIDTLLSFNRIS